MAAVKTDRGRPLEAIAMRSADLPAITGPVSARERLLARDWRFGQANTDRPVRITLPGPMTITDSIANSYYSAATLRE